MSHYLIFNTISDEITTFYIYNVKEQVLISKEKKKETYSEKLTSKAFHQIFNHKNDWIVIPHNLNKSDYNIFLEKTNKENFNLKDFLKEVNLIEWCI